MNGDSQAAGTAPAALAGVFPAPARSAPRVRLAPVMWLPGDPPPTIALADAAILQAELAGSLPASGLARTWSGAAPPSAADAIGPVRLHRLPPWAVIFGGASAVVASQGRYIAEYLPDAVRMDHAEIDRLAPFDLPAEDVAGPVLLTAGPQIRTGTDWLMFGLPAILFAEGAYPGYFRYLLPQTAPSALAAEAILALAIDPARCLTKQADRAYRFADLAVIEGDAPNLAPHALALMRLRDAISRRSAGQQVAFGHASMIANRTEILALLEARGFLLVTDGSFAQAAEARVILLWPDADPGLLMAAPRGVAVILVEPQPHIAARVRRLVGRLEGYLVDFDGSASAAAAGAGSVLDPTVLAGLLDPLPG